MRALRELEPPSADEGFASVEQVPFERTPPSRKAKAGVFVAAAALTHPEWRYPLGKRERSAPHLVFDWRHDEPLAEVARLEAEVSGPVESAVCPHGGGPPTCWCRPPLPGLPLAFARAHGVDPVALGPHRHRARAQDTRDNARRPVHHDATVSHRDYHDEVAEALIAVGNPELGEAIRRDRGSQLEHLGIRFPELRRRVKEGFSFYDLPEEQVLEVWDGSGIVAVRRRALRGARVLRAPIVRKRVGPALWPVVRHWSARVDNWCHSDLLSSIYSRILEHSPEEVFPQIRAGTLRKANG